MIPPEIEMAQSQSGQQVEADNKQKQIYLLIYNSKL